MGEGLTFQRAGQNFFGHDATCEVRHFLTFVNLQINGDKDKEAVLVDLTTALETLLNGNGGEPSSAAANEQRAPDEPSNQQSPAAYDPSYQPLVSQERLTTSIFEKDRWFFLHQTKFIGSGFWNPSSPACNALTGCTQKQALRNLI